MNGYLLVHGKMSGPTFPHCSVTPLRNALAETALTHYEDYPWSKTRNYDVTSHEGAEQMHQGIQSLRNQGATRVHILGHSLGANLALYYSTLDYQDYDSIIALCPAHNLHNAKFQDLVEWSVDKATTLINRNDFRVSQFIDSHMGKAKIIDMKPDVYKSFFDATGPCNMSRSVTLTKTAKPVYMIVGSEDVLTINTKELFFDPMLKDEQHSKFENLLGESHVTVPMASVNRVLNWVNTL